MTTTQQQREAQRRYRERNAEVLKAKLRAQGAKYRNQNAHLSVLEAVTNVEAFWSRVGVAEEDVCWPWTGPKTDRGYGLYAPLPGVVMRTHRVAYALHNGGIDDGLLVCHRCDNPSCCNPKHLFLGTNSDNMRDMVAKGRNKPLNGESNPNAKLTSEQARAIYLDPRTNQEIAAAYCVASSLVSLIRRRQVWVEATVNLPAQEPRKNGPKPRRLSNAELQGVTA
jgi:hypothetical protein